MVVQVTRPGEILITDNLQETFRTISEDPQQDVKTQSPDVGKRPVAYILELEEEIHEKFIRKTGGEETIREINKNALKM